jgi:toxin FitB
MKYLIDTNTLIDAQTKNFPEKALQFLKEIVNENFTNSFITYIEYLGYKNATLETEEFIALADVIYINKKIVDTTIDIKFKHRIKLPDATIAGTAIAYDLTLITHNIKDFKIIEGLNVLDLYKDEYLK